MRRIRCILFGCWCHRDYPGCGRCGAALYDADFIQIAKLDWLIRLWWWLRKLRIIKPCAVCGKRIWFAGTKACCSEKCWNDWLPF
jgi:hypothetical protein